MSRPTGKTYSRQEQAGRRGVNACAAVVEQMGHIWREKPTSDVGVDGEIEIVDPSTRVASGRLLLVQVKTRSRLASGEGSTFNFTCGQDDLAYWLSGTAPVLLVLVSAESGEAWFKNLGEWFSSDPARRRTRVVTFDVKVDRFSADAAQRLIGWAAPASSGLYLRPPPRPETLLSNLLRVDHLSDTVHCAPTSVRGWKDANRLLLRAGYEPVDDIVWRDGLVWSLRRLDEPPLEALVSGTPERLAVDELEESESDDDRRLLVRLLNNTLREVNRGSLLYERRHNYLYFPATDDLAERVARPSARSRGRTVFQPYLDKSSGSRVVYFRHYALKFQFLRLEDGWHLALNPTYHYTIDGRRPSRFGPEYLKGIKRRERHQAVGQLVKFWAGYLRTQHHLFAQPDQRLRFGSLAEIDVAHGIDDAFWKADRIVDLSQQGDNEQGVLLEV